MKEVRVVYNRIDFDYYEKNFESLINTLYPSRQEAVLRLKNKEAAYVSLGAGLMLQNVLEKKLEIEPKAVLLDKNDNGKPYLKDYPKFHFNISHSGDMVFIAYGDSPVGIDVEKLRCSDQDMNVAKRCFTEQEYAYIIGGEDRTHRFTSIWTMKEAYLKYKGIGISVPLNSFEVNPVNGIVEGENLVIHRGIVGDYIYSVCTDNDCKVFCDFEF